MRISVFLDGANFFFMQRSKLGWFADPKRLLDYIATKGDINEAFYYIGQDAPPEARQQAFLDALPSMGYSLVSKQIKTIYDTKTGTTKKKANLDIEIVLDMFNTIDHYDMAVLISGDGDFERALTLLRARGKQLLVIATEGFIARELRSVAGRHYIDMQDIKADIERVRP
ncbi:NYN domain-containing protein [Flavobacterium sp.]|uniref:LabA-like NYN domain-containing protein n=1 Tax=Flavobacterium sp. TaxID=239 RepID=UPI00263578B3|nr:NYN domain-containing protein [Flavobacterium sp.]